MGNKKENEARLNYEGYYDLTGEELNGMIDDTPIHEIDKKLAVLYEDSEDSLNLEAADVAKTPKNEMKEGNGHEIQE